MNTQSRSRIIVVSALSGVLVFGAAGFAAAATGSPGGFAGDAAAMKRVLAMNSIVSFTGIVTFKNGQNVRDTVAATPMSRRSRAATPRQRVRSAAHCDSHGAGSASFEAVLTSGPPHG